MIDIVTLVERGGVFFNVRGGSPEEVIRELLQTVRLPEGLDKERLVTAILEREALMPTAVGNGIAIPHPRNSLLERVEDERIIVAYAKEGIPFQALDKQLVYALFVILSSNQKNHLQLLSQISFLFHNREFRKMLETRPPREELCAAIRSVSKEWE